MKQLESNEATSVQLVFRTRRDETRLTSSRSRLGFLHVDLGLVSSRYHENMLGLDFVSARRDQSRQIYILFTFKFEQRPFSFK